VKKLVSILILCLLFLIACANTTSILHQHPYHMLMMGYGMDMQNSPKSSYIMHKPPKGAYILKRKLKMVSYTELLEILKSKDILALTINFLPIPSMVILELLRSMHRQTRLLLKLIFCHPIE
jgi:hypothetical protein